MELSLNLAKSHPGSWLNFKTEILIDDALLSNRFCKKDGFSYLSGELMFDGKEVIVKGQGELMLDCVCSRCGEEFKYNFIFEFNSAFLDKTDAKDEDEEYYFKGDSVNIDKAVVDTILINLPSVLICKEDCKGLCPHCFTNLNRFSCNCKNEDE